MRRCAKYLGCVLGATLVFAFTAAAQTGKTPKDNSKALVNSFPTPVGQSSSGIHFPYKEDGKLKMLFDVDVLERKDLGHVGMTNANIKTYDDDGKVDLILLLPVSTLDLVTRILATDKPFVLKRTDFELMGDTLELDTLAKKAKIVGNVKMVIFNFNEMNAKEPAHE